MNADDPFRISGKPVIVGTGLIALDIVLGAEKTSTPQLYAGGTCGNLLIIMSYLGWKSLPVSRMNGDKASKHVLADMKRWGVQTECATTKPGSNTPIIVQRIKRNAQGEVSHRFSWTCPKCGAWLPGYAAVPAAAASTAGELVKSPNVFFFDRVSRGAINLASGYRTAGALVVFEPSGVGDPRLFREALECAHIVKYSEDRIHQIKGLGRMNGPLLEIQTRGSEGLRYRRLDGAGGSRAWTNAAALVANAVKDTSGAGDWCCAGIIHRLGAKGAKGLQAVTDAEIRKAIEFGQAMAAWNCKFEGARGGMYACGKKTFRTKVLELLGGRDVALRRELKDERITHALACLSPRCSTH
ncbi:MAG: carbohydrate kinase family protein [Chthoniobacteraceae bacterium]